jgi:hypothetical protein
MWPSAILPALISGKRHGMDSQKGSDFGEDRVVGRGSVKAIPSDLRITGAAVFTLKIDQAFTALAIWVHFQFTSIHVR